VFIGWGTYAGPLASVDRVVEVGAGLPAGVHGARVRGHRGIGITSGVALKNPLSCFSARVWREREREREMEREGDRQG